MATYIETNVMTGFALLVALCLSNINGLIDGKYPTRYISRTCDVTGIQECSSPGDDIETACRNMDCVIRKLQGCDENTIDVTSVGNMVESYNELCTELVTCHASQLADCFAIYDDKDICRLMGCSLEKLDGCDQETIDVITGGNGKTIDEMMELQNELCSDGDTGDDGDSGDDTGADEECDAAGMSDCYSILDTNVTDILCRTTSCVVDKLRGCDQETLDEVTQAANVSIKGIEATRDQLCAGSTGGAGAETCDIQSLASCSKPGHDVETVCGNMECMVNSLEGCTSEQLQEISDLIGTMSEQDLKDFMAQMNC